MKAPSFHNAFAISTAIHLTLFILSIVLLKHSRDIIIPSPYTVSIVSPADIQDGISVKDSGKSSEAVKTEPSEKEKTSKKVDSLDKKHAEERISEIQAKKKLERIVHIRSIISLKGHSDQTSNKQGGQKSISGGKGTIAGTSGGSIFNDYYARITEEIRREWVYPDTWDKNLETIVLVKITKDGTIKVQGIEKSSGNSLFDRSTLRALAKATITAPPVDMELGIRFKP